MLQSLNKTFGWPVRSILFISSGNMIAELYVAKINGHLFSLAHADSLGLVIFSDRSADLTQSLSHKVSNIKQMAELIHHVGLYEGIYYRISTMTVDLSDESLLAGIIASERVKDIHIRSTLPLLEYRSSHKVISSLSLAGGYEEVIAGLNPNVRRKINKARKNGITIKASNTELLDDFYKIYRKNIHKHGSFGLPKTFFRNLSPDDSRLFVAYHNNQPIGSALLTWMMDSSRNIAMDMSENIAFSTLPEFNHLYTSYALHEAMIKASVHLGCCTYSMGRCTPGSPVHNYKKQWGTTDQILYYNSSLPVSDKVARYNFIRPVLKLLPQWLMERFDYFVAKRVF